MLSTPVCGVDIKKEVVADLLAPFWYNDIATGITPHEHRGSGIPINEALIILMNLLPDKFLCMNASLTNACKNPAIIKPNNRKGANLFRKFQYALSISYIMIKN